MSCKKLVNVYALWRDSEPHIKRTLKQLDDIVSYFKDSHDFYFYFYENDSKDNTLKILQEWCAKNNGKVLSETLNSPKFGSVSSNVRTAMLSYYRNQNKSMVDRESDLSLVFDSDLIFTYKDVESLFNSILKLESAVMVTSNCRQNIEDLTFGQSPDSFYDVYCFRDKRGNNGMYFSSAPFYDEEDLLEFMDENPVRVKSAFGGLAVVKSSYFDSIYWSSDFHSEHVNFCYELIELSRGIIYIDPNSKPFSEVDLSKINLDACKQIAENQRNNYGFGNKLRTASLSTTFNFKNIL